MRVGNWIEDLCLEEDLLKDFLAKKDNGELMIQKTHNFLNTVLNKVDLTKPEDGFLHYGDKVCLFHVPTRTVVSAYMSAAQAFEAKEIEPNSQLASSKRLEPCARNVFIIGSCDGGGRDGEVVRYSQPFTLTTLPGVGGQLSLHSDRATFMKHAKHSRCQELLLVKDQSFLTAWTAVCFNPQERVEMEGEPVPVNAKVLINHMKTNQCLAALSEFSHKTPFGLEYEAVVSTKLDSHKMEDLQNHFMLVAGDPIEIAATL